MLPVPRHLSRIPSFVPFAVLDPGAIGKLQQVVRAARQAARTRVRRDDSGAPEDRELTSGEAEGPERQRLREAQELLGVSEDEIGAREHLKSWWEVYQAGRTEDRREQLRRLRQALRIYVREQHETFAVGEESPRYSRPAEALAARGFRAVVFGHTHLVKRVPMLGGAAVYLNTGTWADLMRIPDEVLTDAPSGDAVLAELVEAVSDNQLERWRRFVPTFARIELEGDTLVSADVFHFGEDGRVLPVEE